MLHNITQRIRDWLLACLRYNEDKPYPTTDSRSWQQLYYQILSAPEAFIENMNSLSDSRRRHLTLSLLRAAARSTFTDLSSAVHTFYEAERLGVHFLHSDWIFSPVPNTRRISEQTFATPNDPHQLISMNTDEQLRTLGQLSTFCHELADVPEQSDPGEFHWHNPSFGPYDAAMYYCLIRHFRPATIVEIGAGYSTLIASKALQQNGFGQVICIEPNPRDFLRSESSIHLLVQEVQRVDSEVFGSLCSSDILFVDSSHISKTGSDVNDVFFRIVPALKKGVLLHFHDIFLPFEYPRQWVRDKRIFYNEQYLLLAFLAYNPAFEVVLAHNFLSSMSGERVRAAFPVVPDGPVGGGSFWVRKIE